MEAFDVGGLDILRQHVTPETFIASTGPDYSAQCERN